MIGSEKLYFKWNSFSDHVLNLLRDMLMSPDYADVTLVCDDKKQIRAHKNILCASSPVFNDILQLTSRHSNHQVIYLRGIKHSEMESLVELIYTGSATFDQERLNEFLLVAKNLEIKDLCQSVELENECVNRNEHEDMDTVNDSLISESEQEKIGNEVVNSNHDISETDVEDDLRIEENSSPTNRANQNIQSENVNAYIETEEDMDIANDSLNSESNQEIDEESINNLRRETSPNNPPNEEINESHIELSEGQERESEHEQFADSNILYPFITLAEDSAAAVATLREPEDDDAVGDNIDDLLDSDDDTYVRSNMSEEAQEEERENESLNEMQLVQAKDLNDSIIEIRKQNKLKKSHRKNIKEMLKYKVNHSNDKLSCPHCDSKYSRIDTLNLHIKTKHEGIRYECPYCDIQLANKSTLQRHMKLSRCRVIVE